MKLAAGCYSRFGFMPDGTESAQVRKTLKSVDITVLFRESNIGYKLRGFYNKGVKITDRDIERPLRR